MAHSYSGFVRWRFDLRGCYDAPVAAPHRVLANWDQLLTAWLVRRGSVELRHAGGRLAARAGDWVLLPPGLRRRHRFSDDARILSLRCHVVDAAGRAPGVGAEPRVGRLRELEAMALAVRDAVAAAVPAGEAWDARPSRPLALADFARIQAAVVGWCAAAYGRLGVEDDARVPEPRVAAAQAALAAAPSPAAIDWAGLRRATGLSRAQLDRLFRASLGTSVRGWLEDRLLAEACRRLEDPARAVRAIADALGFGDASHFCRWFRGRTGLPPARWRSAHAA